MTERPQDESKDCGRAISNIEHFTWNGLLIAFHIHDSFSHQEGSNFPGIMDSGVMQGDWLR